MAQEVNWMEDNSICILERYEGKIDGMKGQITQIDTKIQDLQLEKQLLKTEIMKTTLLLKGEKRKHGISTICTPCLTNGMTPVP